MYNRFLYQRSSDFGRRHLRLRTISLRPYKDSSSAPFYPMSPRGATSRHLFAPFSPFSPSTNPPSTNPPRTNRLPAPILTSSLLYKQPPPNTSSPYRHPFPQIAPPSSLPILLSPHAPQSPYLGHLPPIYFAVPQRVHSEHQRPKDFPTRPLTESPTRHSVCSG